jgi:hypothetical protein
VNAPYTCPVTPVRVHSPTDKAAAECSARLRKVSLMIPRLALPLELTQRRHCPGWHPSRTSRSHTPPGHCDPRQVWTQYWCCWSCHAYHTHSIDTRVQGHSDQRKHSSWCTQRMRRTQSCQSSKILLSKNVLSHLDTSTSMSTGLGRRPDAIEYSVMLHCPVPPVDHPLSRQSHRSCGE